MGRVDHKLVKQRLNEKRSKISDKQFFVSRIVAGYFEDLAVTQTRRYHYNRRVRVLISWKPKDKFVASTNNQNIKINAGNKIITDIKGRENRFLIVTGCFAHELGHVLYTDFLAMNTYVNNMLNYIWYPCPPKLKLSKDMNREMDFDLSRIPDWSKFVEAMNYAMMKQFTALEQGGRMAVLMGDIKKKGKLYSMLSEITKPGTLENILIKMQHNCVSNQTQYSGKFIPILHEYVLIVRKDSPVAIPVMHARMKTIDIRDMNGATWRDIVAAVLEEHHNPITLSELYDAIADYKKAKSNQWWREKVRQTLQNYPEHFKHVSRGVWCLQK